MSKIDHSLFSAHEHALDHAMGECPECGKPLHVKHSKSGPFVGCSGYPACTFSKPLHDTQTTLLKTIEGAHCPQCASPLAIKKGRYGMFIGCSGFPECHYIAPLKPQEDTAVRCPKCAKGDLVARTNKYGKQFFACDHYPKCRYVLNSPPVETTCPDCGWRALIKKKGALHCPQPDCDYQQSL